MVESTNELIFRTLQQVQASLAELTKSFDQLERRFDKLERSMDDIRTTSPTSLGFAIHSNLRHETVDERTAELERQFGTLDDLKRRVGILEEVR